MSQSQPGDAPVGGQRTLALGLKRGLTRKCPHCGQGPLFRGYLKVKETCPACNHDNAQYPSDDAPPYFTILIVGHLVIAPLLAFPFIWTWPTGLVLAVTLPSILLATLTLLPLVKGAVIGVQWAVRGGGEGAA